MKKLREEIVWMLCNGAKTCGNFTEGMFLHEEEMYIDEIDEIREFCQWIDTNIGGGSKFNLQQLFTAFKEPNNKEAQKFAQELKLRIAEIRSHTNL